MTLQRNHKIALAIVAVLLLAWLGYLAYKSISAANAPVAPTPGTTTTIQPGLWDWVGKAWSYISGSGAASGSVSYCAQHPDDVANCNSTTDCYNGCSSSNPGYNCSGQLDSNC